VLSKRFWKYWPTNSQLEVVVAESNVIDLQSKKTIALKDNFVSQLTATVKEIENNKAQIVELDRKLQQLKGAIFALETLINETEKKEEEV
jgi:predicted  nucleic acid-binding Zn-ribbon protein